MIDSSNLNGDDYTLLKTNLGSVFLFQNYIIVQFNEGVDINFDNFAQVSNIIKTNFENRPFGFIANRVNSYSINLTDARLLNKNFPNLIAYAVVTYNSISEKVFEIENQFFEYNRNTFKDLESAVEWVKTFLN